MALDGLSYTATSRLRALLCPIGRIKRSRFLEFVERVQLENIVRLGDVSPDSKPNRSTSHPGAIMETYPSDRDWMADSECTGHLGMGTAMFSPQGFPNGHIVYHLTTTHDRDHEYLEPFEPHRRTFLVRTFLQVICTLLLMDH